MATIPKAIALPAGYDADETADATWRYRAIGQTWMSGFPLSRLEWNGRRQFRGSIFQATAGTAYELEITLTDSTPTVVQMVLSGQITTRPNPKIDATSNIRYVSPTGSSAVYTFDNPGNLQVLLAAPIQCGTTIMLRDGDYAVGDLQINLTADCTSDSPIRICDRMMPELPLAPISAPRAIAATVAVISVTPVSGTDAWTKSTTDCIVSCRLIPV